MTCWFLAVVHLQWAGIEGGLAQVGRPPILYRLPDGVVVYLVPGTEYHTTMHSSITR